ncbi:hypothetical protein [Hymenobacter sp. B81]|uniref:hypothetical protein n=1 Tax=Hymenobacter sp. B81 TaxID=3344878 RepID=UPI0037DCBFC2
MSYTLNQLTKADSDQVITALGLRRTEAANRMSNLAFRLETFGNPEARAAEVARLTNRINNAQAELATMPDGRPRRDLEDELGTNTRKRNQLLNQSEKQGPDDRVLLEFELALATQTHAELLALIPQVQTHRDSLPA